LATYHHIRGNAWWINFGSKICFNRMVILMKDKVKSELDAPVWGIVDSKHMIAHNLKYDEAAEQIKSLNGYEATIVTNEVAEKLPIG